MPLCDYNGISPSVSERKWFGSLRGPPHRPTSTESRHGEPRLEGARHRSQWTEPAGGASLWGDPAGGHRPLRRRRGRAGVLGELESRTSPAPGKSSGGASSCWPGLTAPRGQKHRGKRQARSDGHDGPAQASPSRAGRPSRSSVRLSREKCGQNF